MKRQLSHVILLIFAFFTSARSSHFFGGSISWRPIVANVANRTTVTIQLKQAYTWSLTLHPCQAVTGQPTDTLSCYLNCFGSGGIYVKGVCTGYDLGLNVSMSQSLINLTYSVNTRRILAYQSVQWITLVSGVKGWSLTVDINLTARSDNGLINSSPTTSMVPLVVIPVNTGQVLRIPMADTDGDIVRCRWANRSAVKASITIDECNGVCQDLSGAILSSSNNLDNNCTIVFNTSITGYYAIAVQIEDFMPSAPNDSALSSIPLQFLIQAITVTCNVPVIVGVLANGVTIQLPANVMFSTPVMAQPGCNESSIDHFLTVTMPSGMASTSTMIAINSTLFSTTLTWTPTLSQIGSTQMYCTVAIDSNNLQSAQYCLNFVVIAPTSTTSTTSTSTISTSTISTSSVSGYPGCFFLFSARSFYSLFFHFAVTAAAILTGGDKHTDLGLLLGLILGLGLPLCLLLSLLTSCCCCPRWCARSCW